MYYLYIFSLHGVYYEVVYDRIADSGEDATDGGAASSNDAVSSGHDPTTSQGTASNDTQCDEEEENEELSVAAKAGHSNGAALLRCLLKLRQKRKKQAHAEPLPEFIEGAKVDSMKTLTAAVTLRGKVNAQPLRLDSTSY